MHRNPPLSSLVRRTGGVLVVIRAARVVKDTLGWRFTACGSPPVLLGETGFGHATHAWTRRRTAGVPQTPRGVPSRKRIEPPGSPCPKPGRRFSRVHTTCSPGDPTSPESNPPTNPPLSSRAKQGRNERGAFVLWTQAPRRHQESVGRHGNYSAERPNPMSSM